MSCLGNKAEGYKISHRERLSERTSVKDDAIVCSHANNKHEKPTEMIGSTRDVVVSNKKVATNQANTTLGEAGIFNASGANVQTMLSHVTFATINKTTSNTLAISLRTWARSIVRWMRELLLIDSNAAMPTRANLCCSF